MGSAWGIIRVKAHVLNYNSDDTYVQIMICHHPKEREQKKSSETARITPYLQ